MTTERRRVYIAGPMSGLPDWNVPAFHAAAAAWRAEGWDAVNPAECFDGDTSRPYADYMRADLALLLTVEAIAFLPGWERSRGARFEKQVGEMLGLDLYDAETFAGLGEPETVPADGKATNPKDAIGSNKLPLHLWPETATAYGCLGLLDGALKYGRANWRVAGVRASIYVDATRRHLARWFEGEDTDPDSGLPHLAHALACLAIVVDAQAAGKLRDDRQIAGGYAGVVASLTPHVARLKAQYADRSPRHYTIADSG